MQNAECRVQNYWGCADLEVDALSRARRLGAPLYAEAPLYAGTPLYADVPAVQCKMQSAKCKMN